MTKLRVYLDNCVFNRPYDNQEQLRIELETRAKLFIQELIIENKIELYISTISYMENEENPKEKQKQIIFNFFKNAKKISIQGKKTEKIISDFNGKELRPKDMRHLASSIEMNCDYFITTDDAILKFTTDKIKIIDPIEFIKIWEEVKNDE